MIWLLLGAALLAAGSFGSYYAMARWSMLQRLLVAVLQRGLQRMAAAADGDHKHYSIHRTATGQFNSEEHKPMPCCSCGCISHQQAPSAHWIWTGAPPVSGSGAQACWLTALPCTHRPGCTMQQVRGSLQSEAPWFNTLPS